MIDQMILSWIMIDRMIYHDWSDDLSILLIYHDRSDDLSILLIYHDWLDDLPWSIDPIDLSWSNVRYKSIHNDLISPIDPNKY
jgi:hypothetical protein